MIQWDIANGEPAITFESSGARITGVAFVPNQRIISVNRAGVLDLWDAVSGEHLREEHFAGNPTDLSVSSDGRTVFFGELGHLRAWSIDSWQEAYGLSVYQSGKQNISAITLSTQGNFGVYGTEQAYLVRWDLPATGETRRFGDKEARVTFAAVTPNNRFLMLGTANGEIIMQDRATGGRTSTLYGARGGWIWRIAFSPDGSQMFTASADWYGNSGKGDFILWDVATATQRHVLTGFDYLPGSVGFSADGRLAIGSTVQWGNAWPEATHGDTIVWDTTTGAEVLRLATDQWINASLFTEDDRYIITASGRPDIAGVVVWDAVSGQVVRHFLPTLPMLALDLVPGTTTVLAGAGSGEIIQLDYLTGEEIRRFCCHANWVRYLDLSATQHYIIAADHSAVVILWDFVTGQELRRFLWA